MKKTTMALLTVEEDDDNNGLGVENGCSGFDANRIAELKAWLVSQFEAAGKDVPDFEYTPRSIAHVHNIATLSQSKTQAATIVANDFGQKEAEYRFQAARIKEILEHVGLVQESLPSNVVSSAQVLANLSLRKTAVEEKRAKVQQESKELLDYTRKPIARLTYLKRTLAQLEDDITPCEAQMEHWKTNLTIMDSKERQYLQQCSNYKEIDNEACVFITDKALAALAIEDKKRQHAAAEKYLEDVSQSALASSEL
ncbi:hypothetical protein BUALT_Bualt12G0027300 [Buddleja alternifolia]|uniref:HAUS augmin-like complex subunit 1 n=1 Tax=Buddleja alternifolia TaxID=168488 RepID=A0AAV6WYR8_9LAMI|nr:hypothetical protein BUALT_Bualt12G0027300 [Buddleja alternifolia]